MNRLLGALLLLASVLLTACGSPAGSQATAGPVATGAGATAATAATIPPATVAPEASQGGGGANASCSGNDVAAALTAAAAAQNDADSYRLTGTITTTTETEALLEIQKPDRIHAKFGDFEFISVGGQTWRNAAGTWVETPGTDVKSLIGGMGQLDAELIKNATFTKVSVQPTSVDGTSAVEYSYHESIKDQIEADVQLWLEADTCRPIKNVAKGTASSTASTYDVTYSDWNQVTVQAPA